MVTTIDPEEQVLTLVNVFTVDPARQQDLVDVLDEATEEVMRHLPGFISANIHSSLDGTRVVNYAQWRTLDDFRAMLVNPLAAGHMAAAAGLATFDPNVYTVRSVHHA